MTGHHIHHLSPRIPNYELERTHKAEPLFARAGVVDHVLTPPIMVRREDEDAGQEPDDLIRPL